MRESPGVLPYRAERFLFMVAADSRKRKQSNHLDGQSLRKIGES